MCDPFVMGLFGGLPKTGTFPSAIYTDATIPLGNPSEIVISSSDREAKLSCERPKVTQRSRGECQSSGKTIKLELNATSFEMKARISRLSLSDRQTLSLIIAGLVCGITPSLTRKQFDQPIQVLALNTPVGVDAAKAQKASSYSSGSAAITQPEPTRGQSDDA